jgi:hypothetical protein
VEPTSEVETTDSSIAQPMCLRTHRWLGEDERTGEGEFTCAGQANLCAGGETYRLEGPETTTTAAVREAIHHAEVIVRVPPPERFQTWLVTQEPSENPILPERTEDRARQPVIYLTATTVDQMVFQAAHEAAHLMCTPTHVHHWTHEVVAVLVSLDVLSATGRTGYRDLVRHDLKAEADQLSVEQFVRVDELPYPPGFYGRAADFGLRLVSAVGPAGYASLARRFKDGKPDYWGWVDDLPRRPRRAVIAMSPPREATS